jgi:beta-glucosidase
LKGHYPQEYLEKYADLLPRITSDDMEIISQPIDFFAQNLYHATLVEASGTGWKNVNFPVGQTKTAIGWPVTPDSMYWTSKFLYYNYKLPVLISENGMSAHDTISLDGKVHDPNRIDYLHRYLISLKKAYDEGVNIMGYFAWSLLDNFEWAYAYHERFGIVYVDFQTQKRIPKDSAYWYGNTIEQNGNNL